MADDEPEGDNASDERRLFGKQRDTTVGYVASEMGVVRIDLAGDRIGSYSLLERCHSNAIGTAGEIVVVGTDEDVLVDVGDTGACQRLQFGPATGVGVHGDSIFAVGPEGTVGRLDEVSSWFRSQTEDGLGHETGVQERAGIQDGAGLQEDGEISRDEPADGWDILGTVSGPNRIAGCYLAADSGVVRLGDSLEALGLSTVSDVAVDTGTDGSTVLAGTKDGLYRADEGTTDWTALDTEPVQRVVADGTCLTITTSGALRERAGDEWRTLALPAEDTIVDIARGESLFAVTAGGDLFMAATEDQTSDGYEGWRSQPVGVRDVVGFAVLDQ